MIKLQPVPIVTNEPVKIAIRLPVALLLPLLLCLPIAVLPLFVDIGRYRMPEEIPGWTLLFGLPHIIASFQTNVDRDYIHAYRLRAILIGSIVFIPLLLVSLEFPTLPMTIAYITLTIYHTVAQQMGIGLAVAGMRPTPASRVLKWSAVTFGLLAYAAYFVGFSLNADNQLLFEAVCKAVKLPFSLLIAATGIYLAWQARTHFYGCILVTANAAIFLMVPLMMLETQFGILGLMIIRVVHDLSGYIVYIAHDVSRNRERKRNALYRCFPHCAVWWLAPALSIAIACALNALPAFLNFAKWLLIGCYFAHYYMESFIWRGPTPHRAQVSFK